MPLTALDLNAERLKRYRPQEVIRRRKTAVSREVFNRRRAALTARKAARLLRLEFNAKRIILFGSFVRHGDFTLWSDIDIAAQGIPPNRFFEAVGAVTGISAEFKLDLIDLDSCPASIREAIESEAKDL